MGSLTAGATEMTIPTRHLPSYRQLFDIPYLFKPPIGVFGFHYFERDDYAYRGILPATLNSDYTCQTTLRGNELTNFPKSNNENHHLKYWLQNTLHLEDVEVIDLHDPKADQRINMNYPINRNLHGRYHTFLDIGCVEHVFDTRQCLENEIRLIALGGFLVIHTPVKGYYGHGFHVFSPELLSSFLGMNGFELVSTRFISIDGVFVEDPATVSDALIWIVAKKLTDVPSITIPEQGHYINLYQSNS